MALRIVTDSTCDLPVAAAAFSGITVVPAYINIGDRSFVDGVELTREAFYEALPSYPTPPTTAAPSAGAFAETYQRLADQGASAILSIHVAGALSGVLNAARLGAEMVRGAPVHVFDSEQLSMGLGLLALRAAEMAAAGEAINAIEAELRQLVPRTYVLAVLDTLEYLRRSGRVNWAQFGLGTLLQIKPLIRVYRGQVEIAERTRTSRRGLERLLEMVQALGPLERLAWLHIQALDRLVEFQEQARHLVPAGHEVLVNEVTPAIGAHAGPGAVGIACIIAAS